MASEGLKDSFRTSTIGKLIHVFRSGIEYGIKVGLFALTRDKVQFKSS